MEMAFLCPRDIDVLWNLYSSKNTGQKCEKIKRFLQMATRNSKCCCWSVALNFWGICPWKLIWSFFGIFPMFVWQRLTLRHCRHRSHKHRQTGGRIVFQNNCSQAPGHDGGDGDDKNVVNSRPNTREKRGEQEQKRRKQRRRRKRRRRMVRRERKRQRRR